jgi:hypothetical protein
MPHRSSPALPAPKRARLTRAFLQMKRIAQQRQHHVRFSTLFNLFGQDGLLVTNTILAILNIVLAFLQGISLPLGFLQTLTVIALLRDQKTFWMPRRWRSYPLPSAKITKNIERWLPALYILEKITHPRFEKLMRRDDLRRFSLWLLLFLALVITAPIPFMNVTPAIAVVLICFGLLNHDGLIWLLGIIVVLAHSSLYFFWSWFFPHLAAWYHWLF